MKKVKIIACCDISGLIGFGNKLPWSYPEDQKRFKELTMNTTLVVGRKTYESLPASKLPGRIIHVVTRNKDFVVNGKDKIFENIPEAIISASTDLVYIAGGAQVYEEAMFFKMATSIDLTVINGHHVSVDNRTDAATYFPAIPLHYVHLRTQQNADNHLLNHRTYELLPEWYGGWGWEK